ncbi:outer membrane beta-barrel protein [Dendrosporobacter sp. 1207_IL3150]|uniref:outer membrane beta-barrel protein n=1 Tax=Dendrosporobacter sp. 1207_IL3150 TaxID=3084054 RepID=UPI002FD9A382
MKKKVLASIIGAMLVSSVGFAAPVTNLEAGQTSVGYNYSNLDFTIDGTKIDSAGANGFYVEHAVNKNVIIGLEYNGGDITKTLGGDALKLEDKETDFYVQYKVEKGIRLVLGTRNYDQSLSLNGATVGSYDTNKVLYGVSFDTKLADKLDGYTTLLKTSDETEWRLGATYKVDEQTSIDVNYKNKDFDGLELKGVGIGLNYKF